MTTMKFKWNLRKSSAGYVAHSMGLPIRIINNLHIIYHRLSIKSIITDQSPAGYVAHCMGLPIRMVAAVTPNDIVHRTLQVLKWSWLNSGLPTSRLLSCGTILCWAILSPPVVRKDFPEYLFFQKLFDPHSMCYGIRSPKNDFQNFRPITPILQALFVFNGNLI